MSVGIGVAFSFISSTYIDDGEDGDDGGDDDNGDDDDGDDDDNDGDDGGVEILMMI